MSTEARPSFAFLVLAYNHQKYILEHLESIKYLVLTHGLGVDVDLIVNDDCSSDQTRSLIDKWLSVNALNFRNIKTIYNSKNIGTCKSLNNMLANMAADRCKITAGDDVYSYENIFELTKNKSNIAMIFGRTLHLMGDKISLNRVSSTLSTATQIIYDEDSIIHRFKHLSYNNAPNLFYATECLLSPKVRAYLHRFDVVEDWPLQVAIAREFTNHRISLINNVIVYYRRTTGSTYIVENDRFTKDKIRLYSDLITNEAEFTERLRLLIRRFCFKTKSPWINKIANIDFYIFTMNCVINMFKIIDGERNFSHHISDHQQHYFEIQMRASAFRDCC
jgi:glycosyltransferase involved in cell wall biosynthesis